MDQELKNILAAVDHTLLAQGATWEEIRALCDDGIKYGCASVCIPASFVKQARKVVNAAMFQTVQPVPVTLRAPKYKIRTAPIIAIAS